MFDSLYMIVSFSSQKKRSQKESSPVKAMSNIPMRRREGQELRPWK